MKIRATRLAVVATLTAMGCGGPATTSNLAPADGTVTGTSSAVSPTTDSDNETDTESTEAGPAEDGESVTSSDPQSEPSAARSGPALEVTTTSLKPLARDEEGVLIATHLFIRNVGDSATDAPLMRVRTHVMEQERGLRACELRSQHAIGTLRDIAPGEMRKVVALSVCERPEREATAVGFVEFEDEGRDGPHFLGRVEIAAAEEGDAASEAPAETEVSEDASDADAEIEDDAS